jgi:hypothetical protein
MDKIVVLKPDIDVDDLIYDSIENGEIEAVPAYNHIKLGSVTITDEDIENQFLRHLKDYRVFNLSKDATKEEMDKYVEDNPHAGSFRWGMRCAFEFIKQRIQNQ